ncbi:MAG: dTDP-4-amino-4,6-dideoxygalactose transaminase [Luteibaculaceae bacterium]
MGKQRDKIDFNRPFLTGNEIPYIKEAVSKLQLSGNGFFTKKCHQFFENKLGVKKCLLTTSCTDALEMAALLLNIQEGDEVIMPSYTFVSTANAFMLRGATIKFVDSREDHPGMNEDEIEKLITVNTKAIVIVHYAGVAANLDLILELAKQYRLAVVEDAAHCIDAYYKGKPLGSFGDLATFSFHETKNISCGEGGLLVINNPTFMERAEVIWEKGTNRNAFFRGEVDKYGWVDIGSSFLPSELNAAFLFAQLENLRKIQDKRIAIWSRYYDGLKGLLNLGTVKLPVIPGFATNNGHLFYLVLEDEIARNKLLEYLKSVLINAVFHYQSLHGSSFFKDKHDGRNLPNADRYTSGLIRLPFYYELSAEDQERVIKEIITYFEVK